MKDFLKLTPQGRQDRETLKRVISEVASLPGVFSDYDLLVDTRGAETHLSVTDFWELSKNLAETIHASTSKSFRAKIAVLCPVEEFDNAKFFSMCSGNRGLNVRAFTSFENLFEWLGESSEYSSEQYL